MKQKEKENKHWTANSILDYHMHLSFDLVDQLSSAVFGEERVALKHVPERMSVGSMLKLARSCIRRIAIVAYDAKAVTDDRPPIPGTIFLECWKAIGKPKDFFELKDCLKKIKKMS